ncbi:MAG: hypothetical protein A2987_05655 [Omnitrophica bacterium RIFCSPLOWO2_01_FULL_45_10]|nr:MAG: hypothetical protein A2987_05655 [Omnitrophica bacterium RIFCSPLOWO2_01_FULL_45_10]
MRRTNLLITGVGGDIAQGIIKCLREMRRSFYIVGSDIDFYASGRNMVEEFMHAPPASEKNEYISFIDDIIAKYDINYIYPTSEVEILFFHNHRSRFSKKDIKIFINKPFIVDTFFDKYKTVQFLKSAKIPYPDTFLVSEYNNQLSYPIILKSRKTVDSKEIVKVNNSDEFNFYKCRIPEAMAQEYMGSEEEEYTACVFSDGRQSRSIAFKRKLGYSSLSKKVELVIDDRINALTEKIAHDCNLAGSLNIQLRKTDKGFVPFEINPRFSSTVYFRNRFGFRDVKWWIDLFEGRPIKFQLKYKKGVGVRLLSEVFFELR